MNNYENIIFALIGLGGEGSIQEVKEWLNKNYPLPPKDVGTAMADMVPEVLGGNSSSLVKEEYKILERIAKGKYRLIT